MASARIRFFCRCSSHHRRGTCILYAANDLANGQGFFGVLEAVREQFDSLEQFVIQESDLILEAADVDARESRALRPKPVALSQRSDRRGMGACGAADPAS